MFANEIATQVLSLHQFLFTMRTFSVYAVVDSFHMLPRETFVTPNFNTPTSKILQKKEICGENVCRFRQNIGVWQQ